MRMKKKGFTLIEVMIVVAIVGLLAAIAVPNFVRARARSQTNACIANLRQIDAAKQVWAVEYQQGDTVTPTFAALTPSYLFHKPHCPANSASDYNVNSISVLPSCPNSGTETTHHL